jgi:hypothetical protein
MSGSHAKTPLPVAGWIVACAFLNCAGWGLSAIHELNRAGYAVVVLTGLAAAAWWWKSRAAGGLEGFRPRKLLRRFRRPFALAFLVLASLAILGGLLYAPVNYDSLAYRTPRVLNWLAEGHWHWIHTDFARLNARTCGFEWLSAPLVAFMRTDRFFFLINAVSYLLLPGLIFSTLTRAGVRPRTAWHWMWVMPAGYCYILQAGSIVNDMFSAVFALAAVDFALRAKVSGRIDEICLSVLSAALLTGAKASNLPLLLPWFIAMLSAWRVWLGRPLTLCAIAIPAAACSFLPTVALNQVHCGDWTGLSAEHATQLIGHCPPGVRLLNNAIMDTLQNVIPPVFPLASKWNHMADRFIPDRLAVVLQKHFETGPAHWQLDELAVEENSGLGFGATMLMLAGLVAVAAGWQRRKRPVPADDDWWLRLVCIAPWLGLMYTMSQLGLSSGARYLAPYYPLLLMGFLRGEGQAALTAQKWWRICAAAGFALALGLLVISPSRPLWPAGWVMNHYGDRLQSSGVGARIFRVYSVYAARAEAFAPVRDSLPPEEKVVGMVTFDDPETSLWKPFGSRRIRHVISKDSATDLQSEGIRYVLVGKEKFAQLFNEPFDSWLARMNGRVVSSFMLNLRAGQPPFEWVVVQLPAADGRSTGNSSASRPAADHPAKIKGSPAGGPGAKVPA